MIGHRNDAKIALGDGNHIYVHVFRTRRQSLINGVKSGVNLTYAFKCLKNKIKTFVFPLVYNISSKYVHLFIWTLCIFFQVITENVCNENNNDTKKSEGFIRFVCLTSVHILLESMSILFGKD